MLKLVKGCKVSQAGLLSEQYQLKDHVFTANVNADKIEEVFQHFIAIQNEKLFFILELPATADEEEKLRTSDYDPMHKNVYYIDGLSREDALVIMIHYGTLLINDGLSMFGFGVHDNSAELMLDRYNVVSLWAKQPEKYLDFFEPHAIPKVDKCLTAQDTISENTPGECVSVKIEGKTVYDLVDELSDWGIYLAEQREDK